MGVTSISLYGDNRNIIDIQQQYSCVSFKGADELDFVINSLQSIRQELLNKTNQEEEKWRS